MPHVEIKDEDIQFAIYLEKYKFIKIFGFNENYYDLSLEEINALLLIDNKMEEVKFKCEEMNNARSNH